MKTLHFAAALLSLLAGSAPLPAAAQTLGVVAVAEPPDPGAELVALTQELRAAVARASAGVLDASQTRDRMTGQTATATLSELDRAYSGSLATYHKGDYAGAALTLRGVIEELERLPDDQETFSQWTRAMMRLARIEQTLGNDARAHEMLERLVRASPGIRADPREYPPSFLKQIENAQESLRALPVHRLTVQANATGARVFVEGREVGMAPLGLSLPGARYRVSGTVGNLRLPSMTFDLSAVDQTVVLDFDFAKSVRPDAGPGLVSADKDRAKALVRAGAFMGLESLVTASLGKQGDVEYLIGTSYDVQKGMLVREGRVRLSRGRAPPGGIAALGSFLVTGQQSSLLAATTVPSGKKADGGTSLHVVPVGSELDVTVREQAPGRSGIAGWTALGAGALAVGLGSFAAVEGFSARGKYEEARKMQADGSVSADPTRYNQLIGDGNSARSASYAGTGAAVAAAAVSGILGYVSYKRTGELGPFRF